MLTAVEFDGQVPAGAVEVEEVGAAGVLPAKLEAGETSTPRFSARFLYRCSGKDRQVGWIMINRCMVRRRHAQLELAQVILFGLVLPEPEMLMEPWLPEVDKMLEDEEIVEAVMTTMRRRWRQSARRGRAGTPAEVVLRMLALKHLRDWSYDELEREVTGSLVYRRFCRIDAGKVPDAKTMVRLGQVVDGATLRCLLHRLVTVAASVGVTKGKKMRVDTTVVEAPIHHPTDSGLCEDVIRVLSRAMRRLAHAGVELGFKLRNVRRSVSHRMREIAQGLRRRGERAKRAIRKPYRRLLRITGRLVRQAELAAEQAQQQLGKMRGHRRRRVDKLASTIASAAAHGRQVMRQTRARVLGAQTRTPGKIVSIFEPWAQIIRKGNSIDRRSLGSSSRCKRLRAVSSPTLLSTKPAPTRSCWCPRSSITKNSLARSLGQSPPIVAFFPAG